MAYRPLNPGYTQKWGSNSGAYPVLPMDFYDINDPYSISNNFLSTGGLDPHLIRLQDGLAIFGDNGENDGSNTPINAGTINTQGTTAPDFWLLFRAIRVDQTTGEITMGPKYYIAGGDNFTVTNGAYYHQAQLDDLVRVNDTTFVAIPVGSAPVIFYVFTVDPITLVITMSYRFDSPHVPFSYAQGFNHAHGWSSEVENDYFCVSGTDTDAVYSPTAEDVILVVHWDGSVATVVSQLPDRGGTSEGVICYLPDAVYIVAEGSSSSVGYGTYNYVGLTSYRGNSITLSGITSWSLVDTAEQDYTNNNSYRDYWGSRGGAWDNTKKILYWPWHQGGVSSQRVRAMNFTGSIAAQGFFYDVFATPTPVSVSLDNDYQDAIDPTAYFSYYAMISTNLSDGSTSQQAYNLFWANGQLWFMSPTYYADGSGSVPQGPLLTLIDPVKYSAELSSLPPPCLVLNPPGWEQLYPYWFGALGYAVVSYTESHGADMGSGWILTCWAVDSGNSDPKYAINGRYIYSDTPLLRATHIDYASMSPPLRLFQRSDGLGPVGHARLNIPGDGGNQPSSQQAARAPRIGRANTYLRGSHEQRADQLLRQHRPAVLLPKRQ